MNYVMLIHNMDVLFDHTHIVFDIVARQGLHCSVLVLYTVFLLEIRHL